MIKITYDSLIEGIKKPEKTTIRIFDGKQMITYNICGKAKSVCDKMKADGRKGILYSRGQLLQIFQGKTEANILEIALKDIENGVYQAEKESKKKVTIENLKIEK